MKCINLSFNLRYKITIAHFTFLDDCLGIVDDESTENGQTNEKFQSEENRWSEKDVDKASDGKVEKTRHANSSQV